MKYELVPAAEMEADRQVAVDTLLQSAPNAHITQHPGWLAVPDSAPPSSRVFFLAYRDNRLSVTALMRLRYGPFGSAPLVDVFRGPAAESVRDFIEGTILMLEALAPMRPVAVRVDPYWSGSGASQVGDALGELGFLPMQSPHSHVQSLEIMIDVDPEGLISSFKPAARRQVRKALRSGFEVRTDLDDAGVAAFHKIYSTMSATKGATGKPLSFFHGLRDFCRQWPGRGMLLSLWLDDNLLAAISVFTLGRRAVYGFGATSLEHPELPKSHLLHFEAMLRARARGCVVYDLGGFALDLGRAADRTAVQKINFFKSRFGGEPVDFVAGHELSIRPTIYLLMKSGYHLSRRLNISIRRLWSRG